MFVNLVNTMFSALVLLLGNRRTNVMNVLCVLLLPRLRRRQMIANSQCQQLQEQIGTYEEQGRYLSIFGSSQLDVVIRWKREPG